MSLNDKILNSVLRVQTEMLQLSRSHYEDDILPLLNKVRVDLAKSLQEVGMNDLKKMSERSRVIRLKELFQQTDELINRYYTDIVQANANTTVEAGRYTVDLLDKRFNKVLGDGMIRAISLKRIEKIASGVVFGSEGNKHTAGFWWKRQSAYLRKSYQNKVSRLIAADEPIDKIISAIRGTRKANFTDGIMNVTYNQARALVRSSIINTSNAARVDMYKANDDVIKGMIWDATLDGRTTDICIALDGKKWDNEGNPVGHDFPYPGPTAHFACRSTQVPWIKSYSELTGIKKDIAEKEGLRSSMQGAVPRSKKYSQFLREQDADFQDKVLGRERGKLFREGKLKVEELINKDFEKRTIKQLKG